MADMILSKWNPGKSYDQYPLKRAGFFPKRTFNTIDEQALCAWISIFSHFGIFDAFMSHQKGTLNLFSSDNGK